MIKKLLTRKDIEKLGDCSRSKIARIIENNKYGFPPPVRIKAHNEMLYDEEKVLAWLAANDMQKIRIRKEPIEKLPALDVLLAQKFLFCRKTIR